jgi:hypothetical protein
LLTDLAAAQRQENQACARRLRVAGELFEMRREQRGESEDWAVDTWAAVGAEIAAALRISLGKAGSIMDNGLAMQRLPAVSAVFDAGDIDMATYRTIVYRTGLVTDDEAMARIDGLLAARAARWPSLTQGRLSREIDRVVAKLDPDAVRRTREKVGDRNVTVWEAQDGTAEVSGLLFATDAHVLDKRLDDLARTVCESDPRTLAQRRADALGALAGGAERLMCRCASPDCPSATATPSSVVIHVVAERSTLDGTSEAPGYLLGADALVPPELLRELADSARVRPLIDPVGAEPEPQYRPSRGLADFVRARDLTCRAPGCDRPATECDLDHTVPYPRGATHASNIKALCRLHHILKTFWGWRDCQLPDGTVIWTLPDNQVYVTTPGSALLFPALCAPTGALPVSDQSSPVRGHIVMMPKRRITRARSRAGRIATERAHNRQRRQSRRAEPFGAAPPAGSDRDPPPF